MIMPCCLTGDPPERGEEKASAWKAEEKKADLDEQETACCAC